MIYTGQNVKLNDFRLGLKNISISNIINNGQEGKKRFTLAWHAIYLWL